MHPLAEELRLAISSGYSLFYIVTHEEERGRRVVQEAISALRLPLKLWSSSASEKDPNPSGPLLFLRTLPKSQSGVILLQDFHSYLQEPEIVRQLRELTSSASGTGQTVVLMSPVLVIPPELEKDLAVLELPLPNREELDHLFRQLCVEEKIVFPEDFVESVTRAAQGLSENEARRVFTKALRKGGGFKLDDISLIIEEKKRSIRKSEVLEYFELDEDLGQVGGLDEIKRWIQNRSRAFDEEARRFGLPAPRGLLLVGVQGCGKSLMAKAVAGTWRLPLIRMDLGTVFGSASPESAIHRAMTVAESLAPTVLWVDEIEKGFSIAEGSAGNNSSRVLGTFITWLQEKRVAVFVVATANEVVQLPPELLRKGRFDETFFVDLPDVHERRAIMAIHLKKRKRNPQHFDLNALSRQAEHFSGAELEQGIIAGMYRAFGEHRELTSQDIAKELAEIVPLYATYEEKIKALREWAKTRTRKASVDQSLVDLFDKE